MDIHQIITHGFLGISKEITGNALEVDVNLSNFLKKHRGEPLSYFEVFSRDSNRRTDQARLFGTSGIRGLYSGSLNEDPILDFLQRNRVSPKFAYFTGRACGLLLKRLNITDSPWVVMDPRRSSLPLTLSFLRGLKDQGISSLFGGIQPTPCYTMNRKGMTVVITASHNPVEYNGIKIFLNGYPLEQTHERKIEHWIDMFSQLDQQGIRIDPVESTAPVSVAVTQMERRFFELMQNLMETARLRIEYGSRLENCFLPLDLAFGAAACPVDESGRISRLSPAIACYSGIGIPIIGYGAVRHPDKLNNRIGAAYAYHETKETPRPGELTKFSWGLKGYGQPASRVAILPPGFGAANERLATLFKKVQDNGIMEQIPISYPSFSSFADVIYLDDPQLPSDVRNEFESEIMGRQPLPGLMVDGDADRILVTTPTLSKSEIPYLTGDAMIRLFTELAVAEPYDEVVFTVESGIALEKSLELIQHRYQNENLTPFNYQIVTVGDRAIIDYFRDAGKGRLLGGEPSGHIIFGEYSGEDVQIIDNPFITYLKLLDGLAQERFDLDRILGRMFWDVPEVYCARKPESWGGDAHGEGILPHLKRQLELWDIADENKLSPYAQLFIPFYIQTFGDVAGEAFYQGCSPEITWTDDWMGLIGCSLDNIRDRVTVKIANLIYHCGDRDESIRVELTTNRKEWAGPEVIRIYFKVKEGEKRYVKLGEGVFRNSGTSPKNAGYHKIWHIHPISKVRLTDGQLKEFLDRLAILRAEWTDQYILDHC